MAARVEAQHLEIAPKHGGLLVPHGQIAGEGMAHRQPRAIAFDDVVQLDAVGLDFHRRGGPLDSSSAMHSNPRRLPPATPRAQTRRAFRPARHSRTVSKPKIEPSSRPPVRGRRKFRRKPGPGRQAADFRRAEMTKKPIYVAQPLLPPLEEFIPYLENIWESKILTNNGP